MLKYWSVARYFVFLSLLMPFLGWGQNFEDISEILEVRTLDDTVIKGVRLRNEGGQPIILVHGFMENTRTWREVAYQLHENGHDVFMYNMRGHGNGEQTSHVLNNSSEKYNFDRIVAYDIPAMIDHTYKTTGRKAYYVGHSMGTMSGRLTLSGVRHGKEGMFVSQEAIDWSLERIKGAVAVASPTTFKTNYFIYKLLRLAPDDFLKLKKTVLAHMIKKQAPYLPENDGLISGFLKKAAHNILEKASRTSIAKALLEGVLLIENLEAKELEAARLFYKGLSSPPAGIAQNAKMWIKKGYQSIDGRVVYDGLEIPAQLPYVYIGGGRDRLAHPADLLNDMLTQPHEKKLLYALYPEFSHIDLISGHKGGDETARFINELIAVNFKFDRLDPDLATQKLHLLAPGGFYRGLSHQGCKDLIQRFLQRAQ